MNDIVADSSFYIFFCEEIKNVDCLYKILDAYDANIGPIIKDEIKNQLKANNELADKITDFSMQIDLENILKQYQSSLMAAFPNLIKWDKKGEFEVIGMSYFLKEKGTLKRLIIDDKSPYLFVKRNLKSINNKLTRTFGFLIMAADQDKSISNTTLNEIMNLTEEQIILGTNPIYIDTNIWEKDIKPKIQKCAERLNG